MSIAEQQHCAVADMLSSGRLQHAAAGSAPETAASTALPVLGGRHSAVQATAVATVTASRTQTVSACSTDKQCTGSKS
jgi:hypothetical protein